MDESNGTTKHFFSKKICSQTCPNVDFKKCFIERGHRSNKIEMDLKRSLNENLNTLLSMDGHLGTLDPHLLHSNLL
jgi:hypothetical protein